MVTVMIGRSIVQGNVLVLMYVVVLVVVEIIVVGKSGEGRGGEWKGRVMVEVVAVRVLSLAWPRKSHAEVDRGLFSPNLSGKKKRVSESR